MKRNIGPELSSPDNRFGPPHCDGRGSHEITEMQKLVSSGPATRFKCPICQNEALAVLIEEGEQ